MLILQSRITSENAISLPAHVLNGIVYRLFRDEVLAKTKKKMLLFKTFYFYKHVVFNAFLSNLFFYQIISLVNDHSL